MINRRISSLHVVKLFLLSIGFKSNGVLFDGKKQERASNKQKTVFITIYSFVRSYLFSSLPQGGRCVT
jgi:hypothetical protein